MIERINKIKHWICVFGCGVPNDLTWIPVDMLDILAGKCVTVYKFFKCSLEF